MVYGIYQSAAGLQLNQYRQQVLANNMANADTAGFKKDLTLVRERLAASRERPGDPTFTDATLAGLTGGSLVAPTMTSFEAGAIEPTGNPLDVAIAGEGFFVIQDGDAERYTRDGRFTLNEQGELVTVAGGRPVLSEAGTTITVPADAAGHIRIDANGDVRAGRISYGTIGTAQFDDTTGLRKTGANLLAADGATPTGERATLRAGYVEASNVDPIRTMVEMIQVTRGYEMNATLVGLADSTLGRAVNDIARIR